MVDKEEVEKYIINQIDAEWSVGASNSDIDDTDYEHYLDMFDNVRTERNYYWQSDLSIPEFLNHVQDQSADDANAYFARKEFVSVMAQSGKPEDVESAQVAKELIDKTLSRTNLHYFHKFMRITTTKNICGRAFARCWWEQRTRIRKELRTDLINGEVEVEVEDVIKDDFNFDVIDPRNIKYSSEYCYNLRDKNWIIVRFDTTIDKLESASKYMGYINIDKLKDLNISSNATETKKVLAGNTPYGDKHDHEKTPVKDLTVKERYGKDYAVVTERDENGEPLEIEYGYDDQGKIRDGAELVHLVQGFAYTENRKVLIRYQVNPYMSADMTRYIPLIRFECYIHPTKDGGFGDGVASRDLQTAINDTFNANNDNTLLGMLKIIKVPRNADMDEWPLRIEPMAKWPEDADVVDFTNNTVPALNQISYLTTKMSQANAREPGIPILSSAAATTVARAEKQVNVRMRYKNIVLEQTGMVNLYWMILQMSNQFMTVQTAMRRLGEKALMFNADLDYTYTPVSEALDSEASKGAKIDRLNTMLGYIMNSQNPNAPVVANSVIGQIFKLMGKEEESISKAMFDEQHPLSQGNQQTGTGKSPAGTAVNQTGLSQPTQESNAIGNSL